MTNGALPARNQKRPRKNVVWCAAVVTASALGWWGCSEGPSPLDPSHKGITVQATGGGDDDDEDENRKPRITGSGRVDFPPGGPTKNEKPFYQEFSFHFRITNHNHAKGKFEFVDHRTGMRINGKPFRVKLYILTDFTPTAATSECVQGGGIVTGKVKTVNDGSIHNFTLKVCDNGEPGRNAPWDRFDLRIPDYTDPDLGLPYRMWHFPADDPPTGAYLTGGNIQARRVN